MYKKYVLANVVILHFLLSGIGYELTVYKCHTVKYILFITKKYMQKLFCIQSQEKVQNVYITVTLGKVEKHVNMNGGIRIKTFN